MRAMGVMLLLLSVSGSAAAMPGAPAATGIGQYVAGGVWPIWIAALLMLTLATYLLANDRRNPINVAFALLFIARGLADLANGLLFNTGSVTLPEAWMLRLHPVLSIAVVAAALHFIFAYLAQNNARWADRRLAWPLIGGAVSLAVIAAVRPSLYWGVPGAQGGPLFAFTGLYYPLYTMAVWLLIRQSRKGLPDARRDGLFYSALGLSFLPAFVGWGELLFVDGLGALDGVGRGIGFQIGHFAAVAAILPLGLALGELIGQWRSDRDGRAARHLALFVAALALPLLSLAAPLALYDLQGSIADQQASLALFEAFQGIWAIPYPVLVAVGVIRYQASGDQERMRRQMRRFAVPSLFFTVFFAVSEGTEALLSSRWGSAAGLAAAAAMTLLLRPVQEAARRRFIEEPPEAETPQEVHFYREQVLRTLADGRIGAAERRFLANLRETMGISPATAAAIEAELTRT